jgi:hypothetical protein
LVLVAERLEHADGEQLGVFGANAPDDLGHRTDDLMD